MQFIDHSFALASPATLSSAVQINILVSFCFFFSPFVAFKEIIFDAHTSIISMSISLGRSVHLLGLVYHLHYLCIHDILVQLACFQAIAQQFLHHGVASLFHARLQFRCIIVAPSMGHRMQRAAEMGVRAFCCNFFVV